MIPYSYPAFLLLVYVVYSPELNAVIRYSLVYYTIIIQHVVLILLESNIGEMEFFGNGDLLREGRMIEELELEAETIGRALRYVLMLIFTFRIWHTRPGTPKTFISMLAHLDSLSQQ